MTKEEMVAELQAAADRLRQADVDLNVAAARRHQAEQALIDLMARHVGEDGWAWFTTAGGPAFRLEVEPLTVRRRVLIEPILTLADLVPGPDEPEAAR